jgi:hypothetical protein
VVRGITCSAIRRRSARIDLGGKAEGGRGKRFPTFTLRFCFLS